MLQMIGLAKRFGALIATDDVSLSLQPGEMHALIGPNGAGKTTLFNAISGVVLPTAGQVTFNGQDMTRMPPHRRARLGISRTFQITNLFPSLSVEDNMVLALRGGSQRKFFVFGTSTRDAQEETRLGEALTAARLHAHAGTRVRELSYGEQRQLELALAIVVSPQLVLLDEPAAGLSPAERRIVADVIRALPRTLTIVLIEHDMDLALGLADHVTCLHEGRVLIEADPDAIRRDPRVQEVYLGRPHHA
jgi:branched-chain amino acid transport system ATP-binding protein